MAWMAIDDHRWPSGDASSGDARPSDDASGDARPSGDASGVTRPSGAARLLVSSRSFYQNTMHRLS